MLGILDVTLPLGEVDRQLAVNGRRAAGLSGAAILAIVVILWLFFHRRVARPVARLLEATNIVAAGDLEHRLLVRRNDELGLLQRSFNDMTRRLATARLWRKLECTRTPVNGLLISWATPAASRPMEASLSDW